MTPNNLHGHNKNIKWDKIYTEQLDNEWQLIVTLSKEYSNDYFPHVCIKCVVTNGKTHTWSNGVHSFIEHVDRYWVSKDTVPLKFTTKDGFVCEQFIAHTRDDDVRFDWKTNITPEYLLELLK